MKKKAAVLFSLLALALSACGGQETQGFYEKEISEYREDEDSCIHVKMEGMSDGVCTFTGEDSFDPDYITADYAIVIDDTAKEIVYSKNGTGKLYPASMTKCMTALLVLENVEDLSTKVQVHEDVMMQGTDDASSMAGLIIGGRYTVEDLLKGLMIPSGNDAANVLADYVGGDIESFVAMMNARAEELGMFDTHFANPNGIHDSSHYTTAYDYYLLMRECIKHDEFRRISTMKETEVVCYYDNNTRDTQEYLSGNSILRGFTTIPGTLTLMGIKTGYTLSAGRCLVLAAKGTDGHTYISVIAHAKNYDTCYSEMNKLLSLTGSSSKE